MRVAVLGTGYVGLVQSVCLAELGNDVVGIDIDEAKVKQLNEGTSPIYEPGLEELLVRNLRADRLHFTSDTASGIKDAAIVFIAVGTPSAADGRADLSYVEGAATAIGTAVANLKPTELPIVVNKSTVPIGTGNLVERLITQHTNQPCIVVSNPEFLREGSAVNDFLKPDRVVIGTDHGNGGSDRLKALYAPLNAPILVTDLKTAELIKYASNAFLATEISFINSIAQIADAVGADVTDVAKGMKLDKRIGQHAFLQAGIGYGGSCFPKDVQALIRIAHDAGIHFEILEATEDVNVMQRQLLIAKLLTAVPSLEGKTIGVWGLAFKPKTDDMRDAPSLTIIPELQSHGATVRAFDPVAEIQARRHLTNVQFCDNPYEAAADADALLILTDWNEFREPDFGKLVTCMKQPVIIDGRNMYSPTAMHEQGFTYLSIGRPAAMAAIPIAVETAA